MDLISQKISKRVCQWLLALTYVLCCLAFGANVTMTLVDYFSEETIQASTEKEIEAPVMPEVVICNSHTFIDPKLDMRTVQRYKNNTNDPQKMIHKVVLSNLTGGVIKEVTASEELLTHAWGWCNLYRFDPKEVPRVLQT